MPSNLFSLSGKTALVTGASRGLGFAMAKALSEHGAKVIANARDAKALGKAASLIGAEPMAFDVTHAADTAAAVGNIVAAHGRLDILVNNAGIQHRRPLTEWTDEEFDTVLSVNLSACFRLAREAARVMIPNGFGRIINIGSMAAFLGRPTIHAYIAAKAGLHGLTRSMAAELGKSGITVNAIAPGYFATELNTALTQDKAFTSWVEGRTPLGRWGRPDELGGAAVFLASDASSYVNGHVLAVDGGFSIAM